MDWSRAAARKARGEDTGGGDGIGSRVNEPDRSLVEGIAVTADRGWRQDLSTNTYRAAQSK